MPSIDCIRRFSSRLRIVSFQRQFSTSSSIEMDYTKFLSEVSKRREPSVLRELTKLVVSAPKGTISFSTGMPNPSTFPFAKIKVTLKNGDGYSVSGKELDSALQYQPSAGYTPLRMLLQDIQDQTHGVQDWEKRSILVSSGSNDGIAMAIDMLLNVGDPIVVQHPLYSGIESLLKPYNPKYILAEQDEGGIVPEVLHQVLKEYQKTGMPMPKVMYVNPIGANPTGTTLSTDRKKQLYNLAQEYNMIILEDDAYYHLHFLEDDPKSFLSMDTDGRVIRFDSFSKILSSGLRLGVVTGPQFFLRQMELHVQSTTLQTSSIAQVLAYELLKVWGHDKLQEHYMNIRTFYRERRDIMLQAAEKHLSGLAEWTIPTGGMFLWMKIKNVSDTNEMVMTRGIERQIMLVPGRCFSTDPSKPSPYVRAAFSLASKDEIDQGMARLAALIKNEQKLSPN